MRSSYLYLLTAAFLCLWITEVRAETFVGADMGVIKNRHAGFPEGHLEAFTGRLGFDLTEYTTLDFRLATNLSADNLSAANGTTIDQRLKRLQGAYLSVGFGGEINRFYGMLGYTWLTLSHSGAAYRATSSGNDWSWGGGIEHKLGGGKSGTSLLFEYINYYQGSKTTIDGASVGVKFLLF